MYLENDYEILLYDEYTFTLKLTSFTNHHDVLVRAMNDSEMYFDNKSIKFNKPRTVFPSM